MYKQDKPGSRKDEQKATHSEILYNQADNLVDNNNDACVWPLDTRLGSTIYNLLYNTTSYDILWVTSVLGGGGAEKKKEKREKITL